VIALISVAVTLVVRASLIDCPLHAAGSGGVVALPSHLKSTRTGLRKFEPRIVMVSPPSGRPVVGVIEVIVGVVEGVGVVVVDENVIVVVLKTLFTVAVTTAAPADAEVSVAVAMPFVVVLMTEEPLAPVSVNVPVVVVN
jgi:hypothetical protein